MYEKLIHKNKYHKTIVLFIHMISKRGVLCLVLILVSQAKLMFASFVISMKKITAISWICAI